MLTVGPAKCWGVYRVGGCLSEMLHYVTAAPRIAAVCLARHWDRCDVGTLAVIGPNPDETGTLLFLQLWHTRLLHTHTYTLTNAHTYGTDLGFSSATVQNAPRINTWSRTAPERPVAPLDRGCDAMGQQWKVVAFRCFLSLLYEEQRKIYRQQCHFNPI